LRIVGAASVEQEAQAVDVTVREWLLAGRRSIAVVVQDRAVARRARALLERAQVLVKDEAGWAFSTTSAATAVGRWLDVAGGDCYHRDLLDLMKSPFAFHDWERAPRQRAVWRLEADVRKHNVVSGIGNFIRLAESRRDAETRQMLLRVRRGMETLGRGRRTIAGWLAALAASLHDIGVGEGLAADSAGEQLLELLAGLERELAGDALALELPAWRRWLARQLEAATFRDRAIDSPVVFTSLSATRLRQFDAALVAGGDADHFPGPDPVAMLFNQGVRAELGMPTWAESVREMEQDLAGLIASCGEVVVTWQRLRGGERNLLSPIIERLDALHRLAWTSGLDDAALAARLPLAEVRAGESLPEVEPTRQPAPSMPPALLPRRISASAYNALLACPYRFYAGYALRLAELDDVQEGVEKKDYGSILHAVLARFHGAHPRVSVLDPAVARDELERLSDEGFAAAVSLNYLARAWLLLWKGLIPGYLDWQREREAAGWSWQAGEAECSREMATSRGRMLVLHGRLDRVDVKDGAAYAVIDYKARAPKALADSLRPPGEDVQLAVYALLWGEAVTDALYLSLDRKAVKSVAMGQDVPALAAAAGRRLAAMFDAIADGAPLPAQGVAAVCGYCEVRGLCRRGHWNE
jgi:ATP-dependent helicase/nuclease subunit B